MKVSQFMTGKLVTATPDTGARSAYFLMVESRVRHLPVVEDGALVGLISDRDLRRPDWVDEGGGVSYPYALSDDMLVGDLMSREVETVKAGDKLHKAVRIFEEKGYGALPVVDKKGDLAGILSIYDLLPALNTLLFEAKGKKGKKGA